MLHYRGTSHELTYSPDTARLWVTRALEEAARPFNDAFDAGQRPALWEYFMGTLEQYLNDRLPYVQLPPELNAPGPPGPGGPSNSRAVKMERRSSVVTTG